MKWQLRGNPRQEYTSDTAGQTRAKEFLFEG